MALVRIQGGAGEVPAPINYPERIKNVSGQYKHYSQVKPVLVNGGDRPIFLNPFKFGAAQVSHLNKDTGKWEPWSGLQERAETNPPLIKIESRKRHSVLVNWGLFVDDMALPPKGRYKIRLQYSLEPWSTEETPKQIYTIESKEFCIAQ